MQINFVYDPSVATAPAAYKTGLQAAADYLDNLIKDPITLNVSVGWGEIGGQPIPNGSLSQGGPGGNYLPYATVKFELAKFATSIDDLSSIKSLPAADPTNGGGFWVSYAQQKAWGIIPADSTEIDGGIAFRSDLPLYFGPSNIPQPGFYTMIGPAIQEISHVMDRYSSVLSNAPGTDSVLDLFRFTAPGVLATDINQVAYFSVDNGKTNLGTFSTANAGDPSDWASPVTGDAFGGANLNTAEVVTPNDIKQMDVLGFNVGAPTPPPPPPPAVQATIATEFNASYYLNQNPDVAASGIDPLTHYETYGWIEGRNPSAVFNTNQYLAANPDVAAAHVDPMLQYINYGQKEGRMTFLAPPQAIGPQNPLVDNAYYYAQNPDVAAAGVDPFAHYDAAGWHELRNPDALFNTAYYLQQNPDVAAAGIDPLVHYEDFGWKEGRNPSPEFSTNRYLAINPDVAKAGIDPLVHYEMFGKAEGRQIFGV